MKNKVKVNIVVPSLEEVYNVLIPINRKTIEVIFLLNKAINEITFDSFPINDTLSLIDGFTGTVYDVNKTIKENKVQNGSKLILL